MLTRNAHLYNSPPSTFSLPSYAEHLAQGFIAAPSPILPTNTRRRFNKKVLKFIDIEADQCDQHFNGASPSM